MAIVNETVTATALASDLTSEVITELVIEVATASDETTPYYVAIAHDVASAIDETGTQQTTTLVDIAAALDLTNVVNTAMVAEAATASDTVTPSMLALIEDVAQASDELVHTLIGHHTVSDVAQAYDSQVLGLAQLVNELATANDEVTPINIPSELVEEVATATDDVTNWAVVLETLEDICRADDDVIFAGGVYNNLVVDSAKATDWTWSKDMSAIAWVMNTESGGLTSYENFEFTSMAFHNGKLYGTSPEGLFELGADTDEGRNIDALSKGGFLDFGSEETKRVPYIYVGYTGGMLNCEVETYGEDKGVYTYDMEYREADAPRNSRIKPGRGLSSRYWRFTFRNLDGADFQIQDVAIEQARSKRRL